MPQGGRWRGGLPRRVIGHHISFEPRYVERNQFGPGISLFSSANIQKTPTSCFISLIFGSLSHLDNHEIKMTNLTPRLPMRQIGALRPLRRNCARLRDRRMSWIASKKSDCGFSVIHWSWESYQTTCTFTIQKSLCNNFYKFHDFSTLREDCARLRDHRILKIVSKRRAVIPLSYYEPEVTPVERFYDLIVSRNPPSKSKNREICEHYYRNFFGLCEYVWFDRFSSFNEW